MDADDMGMPGGADVGSAGTLPRDADDMGVLGGADVGNAGTLPRPKPAADAAPR